MRRLILTPVLLLVAVLVVLATGAFSGGGGTGGGTYLVRALFDNAGFATGGEQLRIAGAPVGTITGLSVTRSKLAAVTLAVTNRAFVPWHADAFCTIRPQSLIAERYVDCTPGTAAAPVIPLTRSGPAAGTHVLPVTRTSSPIDPDVVQNISEEPVREALSVLLDQLGTGLAARGADLRAVIERADPALGQTERVLSLLAAQDHTLARLATDSRTVLAPLAAVRASLARFVTGANTTAVAVATERAALQRQIAELPEFLAQLRPLMRDLGGLADQGTPLLSSLGQGAAGLDREFATLTPFARAARGALVALATAARRSQSQLVGTEPLARSLGALGVQAVPSGRLLAALTASLKSSGAIDQLMALLYGGAGATNGFDADGHYVRTDLQVGSCTAFARTPVGGCASTFGSLTQYLMGR